MQKRISKNSTGRKEKTYETYPCSSSHVLRTSALRSFAAWPPDGQDAHLPHGDAAPGSGEGATAMVEIALAGVLLIAIMFALGAAVTWLSLKIVGLFYE